jgi:hypothetical protein
MCTCFRGEVGVNEHKNELIQLVDYCHDDRRGARYVLRVNRERVSETRETDVNRCITFN